MHASGGARVDELLELVTQIRVLRQDEGGEVDGHAVAGGCRSGRALRVVLARCTWGKNV